MLLRIAIGPLPHAGHAPPLTATRSLGRPGAATWKNPGTCPAAQHRVGSARATAPTAGDWPLTNAAADDTANNAAAPPSPAEESKGRDKAAVGDLIGVLQESARRHLPIATADWRPQSLFPTEWSAIAARRARYRIDPARMALETTGGAEGLPSVG
jgi:hypothetical protein